MRVYHAKMANILENKKTRENRKNRFGSTFTTIKNLNNNFLLRFLKCDVVTITHYIFQFMDVITLLLIYCLQNQQRSLSQNVKREN